MQPGRCVQRGPQERSSGLGGAPVTSTPPSESHCAPMLLSQSTSRFPANAPKSFSTLRDVERRAAAEESIHAYVRFPLAVG